MSESGAMVESGGLRAKLRRLDDERQQLETAISSLSSSINEIGVLASSSAIDFSKDFSESIDRLPTLALDTSLNDELNETPIIEFEAQLKSAEAELSSVIVENPIRLIASEAEAITEDLAEGFFPEIDRQLDLLSTVNQLAADIIDDSRAFLVGLIELRLADAKKRVETHLESELKLVSDRLVRDLMRYFLDKAATNQAIAEAGIKVTSAIQPYIPVIMAAGKAAEALQAAKAQAGS